MEAPGGHAARADRGCPRENYALQVDILVAPSGPGVRLTTLDEGRGEVAAGEVSMDLLPGRVAALEVDRPRWVWTDTSALYPELLRAGVRVERCFDLRLCHAILRHAIPGRTTAADAWAAHVTPGAGIDAGPTLLDELTTVADIDPAAVLEEYARQQVAVQGSLEPGRLRLLLAAESAGALIAAEMKHDGLPWDLDVHDRQLAAMLGPRPRTGTRPARLEELATTIRAHLAAPALNPDSPAELLRALRSAGIEARTTRKWELADVDHPVIAPLLEYKRLSRLLTANGWVWMDTWIRPPEDGRRGRFHPDYVPGGVVTGRWATSGGGVLALPKQIRSAVVADPGWKLVVADAAQIEPRVLAAMSRDEQLARASQGADLYQALVEEGIVDTRAHAKVAMLGALYGATTGEAGLLMPRLLRAYPKATNAVEQAARAGERGEVVRTWLGRTSPLPSATWHEVQGRASQPDAEPTDQRLARQQARDWGRFTRNFVVQGTAAEWALCWMAELRRRLLAIADDAGTPHLVFFLHDEVIVHSPAHLTQGVEAAIRDAAQSAGGLLFGTFPVEFAIDVVTVDSYDEAA